MPFMEAAVEGLQLVVAPQSLTFLLFGVVLGLTVGLVPGLGGVVGLALLIPFVFHMEPATALPMMIGLVSVTATSDTVPSVLFGIPGSAASQATILDGHPLARQGQAGRALSAAYGSSLLGALVGCVLLVAALPALRPFVLAFGSPELFALGILGITMVAVLAGRHPLKGLVAGLLGVGIGLIGVHVQSGFLRWTGGHLYLFDGIPLPIVGLGLFALPELWDMVIQGTRIADVPNRMLRGTRDGLRDLRSHWALSARCGVLGTFIGAVPGVGGAVADWLTYGYAKQTCKGAQETFGTGDIRGVIAPESANNAKDVGALVPTLAFGIPGSASMALVLVGMLVVGIQPGPDMLHSQLPTTLSIVWMVPLANLLGAGLMLAMTNQFAKVSTIRIHVIAPLILVIIVLAAYQTSRSWGDIVALLALGLLGFFMKRTGWPRPPLLLGFVLSAILEKYFFLTIAAYGTWAWLLRPIVVVVLALGAASVMYSWRRSRRAVRI